MKLFLFGDVCFPIPPVTDLCLIGKPCGLLAPDCLYAILGVNTTLDLSLLAAMQPSKKK